jgi:hypothetical protein
MVLAAANPSFDIDGHPFTGPWVSPQRGVVQSVTMPCPCPLIPKYLAEIV